MNDAILCGKDLGIEQRREGLAIYGIAAAWRLAAKGDEASA